MLKFEWDETKNKSNRKKHGVWFEEAIQVFDDTQALMYFDDDHSIIEDRFILLGSSASDILVVIYCERHKSIIRIISARKATKKETKQYEKGI
jgi:uncharacterized DUF497 family protein